MYKKLESDRDGYINAIPNQVDIQAMAGYYSWHSTHWDRNFHWFPNKPKGWWMNKRGNE